MMRRVSFLFVSFAVCSAALCADGDDLAAAFCNPPREARPETWFHVIAGNVSTNGLKADFAAVRKGGFSGVQFFHEDFGGPWPGVTNQTRCLSANWDAYVRFAAEECRRLGLTFKMQNCPGWSMAGGPWIAPTNAMRDLVFSRTIVEPGAPVPPLKRALQADDHDWRDYRDIAVVAFPSPDGDAETCLTPVSVTGPRAYDGDEYRRCTHPWWCYVPRDPSQPMLDGAALRAAWREGFSEAGRELGIRGAGEARFDVDFGRDVRVRTIEITPVQQMNHRHCYAPEVTLRVEAETSAGWCVLRETPMPKSNWMDNSPLSLALPETTARRFRVTYVHRHDMAFAFTRFRGRAVPDNWEADAAYVLRSRIRGPHLPVSRAACVDPASVVDLTAKMRPDGSLDWQPPSGRWTVLRIGHVNAGHRNSPAPEAATGWECDKLAAAGADAHYDGFIGRLVRGPLAGGLLQGLLLDSWECASQTWTPGLDRAFRAACGRDLCWPALCGYVCGDREATRAFFADWRRFLSDRVAREFYGRIVERAHADGLSVAYETAGGDVFPGDPLDYWKHADVPMCEFWQPRTGRFVGSLDFKPIRPCASAAHLYGKPRVDAEAFTGHLTWDERLVDLVEVANFHFAQGVTHMVTQGWIHDPRGDDAPPPGGSLGGNGTPFNRRQKWVDHLDAFTAYLARCTLLLERGKPVRDVLLYLGDDVDHLPTAHLPDVPEGFKYDYCTADALLTRLTSKNGAWTTPDGIRYGTLWLRDTPHLRDDVKARMTAGVAAGCVVVTNFAAAALPPPDVSGGGTNIVWEHRREGSVDRYFVATNGDRPWKGKLSFRATGRVSVWNPQEGSIVPAEGRPCQEKRRPRRFNDDIERTEVALDLKASGCVFVVFDRSGAGTPSRPAAYIGDFGASAGTWRAELLRERALPASQRKTWALSMPD